MPAAATCPFRAGPRRAADQITHPSLKVIRYRSTAICSVEAVDGEPVFSEGPYVETKEHLGGFAVVDVPDDETARYWAGRLATALDWPQEVHRFRGPGARPA
ncbi:hypothetical protein D7147_04590 [Micromonospora musae]|uniref:YCII-related domain-containing protein n=1 Tax=Micromonospora musae TaxID=1894970 RepID=A0ABX9REY8_9ACTN|nr:hypothetical protein D7147_04590 [Micromonospora musae]